MARTAFSPREVIANLGHERTAEAVPFAAGWTVELSADLLMAYATIEADRLCPNGVFPTSCAVGTTRERTLARASFEAVERYCLAASEAHANRISPSVPAGEQAFDFGFTLKPPFGQSHGPSLPAAPMATSASDALWVACADVFAPFEVRLGHCYLPPSTNGTAVGATLEDAAARALREAYERHSIMHFWFEDGGRGGQRVEQSLIDDAAPAQIEFLDRLAYDVLMLEVGVVADFPVVLAFARNRHADFPFLVCAAGSGPAFEAVEAAAAELVQTLVAASLGAARCRAWERAGKPLNSLEHNMWWYASPATAQSVVTQLWETWARRPCARFAKDATLASPLSMFDAFRVDITPPAFGGEVHCARVLSSRLWPLVVSEAHGPLELTERPTRHPAPHPFP